MEEQIQTSKLNLESDKVITPESVLFFDLDGTLVNTDYANFLSYKKAIESVLNNKIDLFYNPIERFNRSLLKSTISNLTEKEMEMIVCEKEKCYNDFLTETTLNTENADILFKYSKTNKTVLVTNCRKERAIMILNHHRLSDKFSNAFYRQFSNNKDMKINKYQNAISTLGIVPDLVIAFENEEIEIEHALKAGIKSINPSI